MLSLILAGEAIFVPIYHLNRYFKTSLLATFALDESQVGSLFWWFGGVSMACYLLGGPIADRFSPRKLIALSLLLTAGGGLYMATLPTFAQLKWLFAGWGVTAILTFWAPLMRATREWGGELAQGRAFGLLDGGRGLVSALIASAAAWLFANIVGGGGDAQRQATAVQALMCFYSGCCVVAAACVWAFLPKSTPSRVVNRRSTLAELWGRLQRVAQIPAVWFQALVVLTAYAAFRGFDNYGRYVEVAFQVSETRSAHLMASLSYLRAVAALGAGVVADRLWGVANTIALGFVTLIACFVLLLLTPPSEGFYALAVANMATSAVALFGLRGVYFALFEESQIPPSVTGMAIGFVSFVGFTPDMFFPQLYGWLVTSARDAGDEMLGYERLYGVLIAFSAVGLVASQLLRWVNKRAE